MKLYTNVHHDIVSTVPVLFADLDLLLHKNIHHDIVSIMPLVFVNLGLLLHSVEHSRIYIYPIS